MRRYVVLTMLLMFMVVFSSVAWANTDVAQKDATPEITFAEALQKAKDTSKSLQSASYDIDRSYEVRKNISGNVSAISSYNGSGGIPASGPSSVMTGLAQANLSWQMSKRTLSAQEDSTIMQVYQSYDGILQALESVNLAEVQLKNAEQQRNVANANVNAGVLSTISVVQAQTAVETANTTLEAAKKTLNDDYQKFNQLIGLNPNDRPILTDKPIFAKIDLPDLDSLVSRLLDASPTVWLKHQQIDLAKLNLDLYNSWNTYNGSPYEAVKIDLKKAEISADDTRDQLDKLIRTLYYKTKTLEDQYESAQQSINLAEETLRVTKVKFDVGMAINADVVDAEAKLAQAKQSLVSIVCQHDILVYALSKPWAYASAGA